MSTVANCPTCGGISKTKETNDETIYEAIQNNELLKKVGQMKKAMQKFKEKAEALEIELNKLKDK
ncbi:hypothetical protein [Polaribacter ponticola]|uniref:DUF2130 domain-containing protein n=1 Tax=Polaribacter ponticola TaxID=2978475 RepID=A0ABT5S5A3_9FLAO|nr:hypothetical protein [Polaribacter sp. MSW5]MDD7913283.1 hypothetical protein [Polaribacter sp. MSW5]